MRAVSVARPILTASEPQPFFPIEPQSDDDGWTLANGRWLAADPSALRRSRYLRAERPLVLCGHGVHLKVDKGTLLVRNGFTHYPQERETHRYFKGDLNLPPRIIMLDGTGSLSFDVLDWLSAQGVSLIRLDYKGEVTSIIAGSGSAFDPHRVAWQDFTRADPIRRIAFCCDLICEKLRASLTTMTTTLPQSRRREIALQRAAHSIARLEAREVSSVNDILMVEAGAAARYFSAWRGMPLRWRSRSRHPVPETWLAAGSRRTLRDTRFANNRHATHPINAMLNYGYGVLHSQVQAELVAAGYDPRRGIMHESRTDAAALVLDVMETRRPIIDAAVLTFVNAHTFSGADFATTSTGVCRLVPQLARTLVAALPI